MFLASLNLALLSLCYIGSGNQILDSGNMDTPSYNQQYGVYEISFGQETGVEYLLRYDDVTILSFTNDITNVGHVYYNVAYSEYFNFSVYVHLVDVGFLNFPTNVYERFDTLTLVSGQPDYYGFSYDYELSNGEYASDSQPSYVLSITLLDRNTYDSVTIDEYQLGYDSGFNDGYDVGKQDGISEGYNTGRDDGYTLGYDTGRTDGYTQGYNTALSGHNFSFTNLFASISDTPILMIRRLFGFEIFGTSVMAIFMSLFTALIVIKVIKRVF